MQFHSNDNSGKFFKFTTVATFAAGALQAALGPNTPPPKLPPANDPQFPPAVSAGFEVEWIRVSFRFETNSSPDPQSAFPTYPYPQELTPVSFQTPRDPVEELLAALSRPRVEYSEAMIAEFQMMRESISAGRIKALLLNEDNTLRPGIAAQLCVIRDAQRSAGRVCEVFGLLKDEGAGLKLEIVDTAFQKQVADALDRFLYGDVTGVPVLETLVNKYIAMRMPYGDATFGDRMIGQLALTYLKRAVEDPWGMTVEQREHAVQLIRDEIASSLSMVSAGEMPVFSGGFLGNFHVHPCGTPPSDPDVENNRSQHLPGMVISLDRGDALKVYLVHSGRPELLFCGNVPSGSR